MKKAEKKTVATKGASKVSATTVKKVVKKAKTDKISNPPVSHGVGRRKSSVARVWMRKGKGSLRINGLDYTEYFDTETNRIIASTPFAVCKQAASFDMDVNINGGGVVAQADAVKLGVARALVSFDENLKPILREHGLLTVDSRVKERKKYGQKAARRKFQFVKR